MKSLNPGDTVKYYFTASSSGLYAVETTGTTDTYATVTAYDKNNVLQTYADDDSGVGDKFNIGFYQKQNTVAVITVNHHGSSSGMFTIHVHRQKANVYTYDYSGSSYPSLNTYSHASTPVNICTDAGYFSTNYKDKEYNFFKSYISPTNESNTNAEVFMFSGHGSAGYAYPLGSRVISYLDLQSINGFKMPNTKIALWNSCYSACYPSGTTPPDPGSGYYLGSLIQASYWSGARSVIGWTDEIFSNDVKNWTNDFFQELDDGQTVLNAALSAGHNFLLPDNSCVSKWSLIGSTSTVLTQPQVNIKGNNFENEVVNKDDFLDDLREYDYTTFEFENGVTRYYKTVNGILTNDYYDVYGDIILKSDETISASDISQIEALCLSINYAYKAVSNESITINGELYSNLISENEVMMSVKKDNNIKIVDFLTSIYENEDGFHEKQVNCRDLITGEILGYEQLIN